MNFSSLPLETFTFYRNFIVHRNSTDRIRITLNINRYYVGILIMFVWDSERVFYAGI